MDEGASGRKMESQIDLEELAPWLGVLEYL